MLLRCYLFLSITLQLKQIHASDPPPRWEWTWSCLNETCVKSSEPNVRNGTSLEICRLVCGKHGSLWPLPTGQIVLGQELILIHPSKIKFDYSDVETEEQKQYLQRVSKIFQNKLFATCGSQCNVIPDTEVVINIKVSSPDSVLNWETDEKYSLEITSNENSALGAALNFVSYSTVDIQINSKTIFGSRHALETLSQLIASYTPSDLQNRRIQYLAMVSSAKISDSPAYPHRGLLLDTARHYLSVATIFKTLDAMAMTKLNVLHWHATDTQSFPLEIPRVPQMSRYGAYSSDQIYTISDIKSIVEYAKLRGIRVIMEIDAPAHAGNGWQWGEDANLGKLSLCINQQPWRKYCIQPPCGQLNPINDNVYQVLQNVFADLIENLAPGEAFHMGGDEVFVPCWNSSWEITEWMSARGLNRTEEDFLDLWGLFQSNTLKAFSNVNPTSNVPVILWSSRLTEPQFVERYLDKDRYIIQTWLEASSPIPHQLLAKGYRLILSTKDKWYLDHGFWGRTEYHSWKVAYNNKLPKHPYVLGGEAAMWSERVDEYTLDFKVWPRTAAVAERLWSNPKFGADQAEQRFEYFRQKLVNNGINADPVSPYYCYQNEEECI